MRKKCFFSKRKKYLNYLSLKWHKQMFKFTEKARARFGYQIGGQMFDMPKIEQ